MICLDDVTTELPVLVASRESTPTTLTYRFGIALAVEIDMTIDSVRSTTWRSFDLLFLIICTSAKRERKMTPLIH